MRTDSTLLTAAALVFVTFLAVPVEAADPLVDEGYALLEEGDYRKAWARFQAAAEQGPSSVTLIAMVNAAIPLAEYGVAAELAEQAIQLAKDTRQRVEAATLLGRVHMEASLYSPEHRASEEEAGLAYLDRAVELFSQAIALSPALAAETNYWLAFSYLERGERDLAAEAAATYLRQRPEGEYAAAAKAIQEGAAVEPATTPPSQKRAARLEYSGKAREEGVKGVVVIQGIVDEKGRYNDLMVIKGVDPALDDRVLKQVSRWRLNPAEVDGQPTTTHHRENVRMTLRGHDPSRQVIPPK